MVALSTSEEFTPPAPNEVEGTREPFSPQSPVDPRPPHAPILRSFTSFASSISLTSCSVLLTVLSPRAKMCKARANNSLCFHAFTNAYFAKSFLSITLQVPQGVCFSLATRHSPLPTIFFRSNTYRTTSKHTTLSTFRMNTYEKSGGVYPLLLTRLAHGWCPNVECGSPAPAFASDAAAKTPPFSAPRMRETQADAFWSPIREYPTGIRTASAHDSIWGLCLLSSIMLSLLGDLGDSSDGWRLGQ